MSFWRGYTLLGVAFVCLAVQPQVMAGDAMGGTTKQSSWTDPFTSFFKGVGNFVSGKPKPATEATDSTDPTVLKNKGKAGPDTRLALAGVYERQGNMAEAEKQYQLALKESPKNVKVLCGLARLRIRQGKFDEAMTLYQQAVKIAPDDPLVLNDMALCHARQSQWADAIQVWKRCAQLEPKNALYRNNLAAAMVEAGQVDGALDQLRAVHGEAAAHYNLGYLLAKKGVRHAAVEQFQLALQKDPSLDHARYWLQNLGAEPRDDVRVAARVRTDVIRPSDSGNPMQNASVQGVVRGPSRYDPTPPRSSETGQDYRQATAVSQSRPQPKILRAADFPKASDSAGQAGGPTPGIASAASSVGTPAAPNPSSPARTSGDVAPMPKLRPLPPVTGMGAPSVPVLDSTRDQTPSGDSGRPRVVPLPPVD